MSKIKSKKGLTIPMEGAPQGEVLECKNIKKVAILGDDYIDLKPQLAVAPGDNVQKGQLLFTDKKRPGTRFTAPANGTVLEVNRGEKRRFLSLVIELSEDQSSQINFENYKGHKPEGLSRDDSLSLLLESGLWTALRTRPFGNVPDIGDEAAAIFVTAMESSPLAVSPELIIENHAEQFETGIQVLSTLTEGKIHICCNPGKLKFKTEDPQIDVHEFQGPHPADLPGFHIHKLHPVNRKTSVWHINCQDVVIIGQLFRTGKLWNEKYVSLAGPEVKEPKIIKTLMGASLKELTAEKLSSQDLRVISGPLLSGRDADNEATAYLGRYHNQVSALPAGDEKEFLGWMTPGFKTFSLTGAFLSSWLPFLKPKFTTSTNGSLRAIVPTGVYDKVFPFDILPVPLLRSLAAGDLDMSEKLGALELEEEDLAVLSFACPSKIDHGANLRKVLNELQKEMA